MLPRPRSSHPESGPHVLVSACSLTGKFYLSLHSSLNRHTSLTHHLRIMNYGITKATPLMMTHMGYGTFLFFGVSTYIGVIWIFFCLPELKGRSIESMDDLFTRSLWTMWRHAYPTEEEKVRQGVQDETHNKGVTYDEEDSTKGGEVVHQEKRVL